MLQQLVAHFSAVNAAAAAAVAAAAEREMAIERRLGE